MQKNIKGPVLIVFTALLWSFGGMLIKLIPWNAMTIIAVRSLFAAAVMAVYMKRPRITLSPAVILGGLSISGTMILFVYANKLTTAANAIVLQYSAPAFVLLFSIVFFKKRAKGLDIAAVIAVFAGIALFFLDRLRADAVLGNVLACLSGVTFAGIFLINQMPGAKPEESTLLGHLISLVIGIPFIVTGGLTFEPVAWISVALLGLFQLGLAYVLFCISIKITPPLTASLIATIEPILNPIWVMIATGETPGAFAIAGGAIVVAAILVYNVMLARQGTKARMQLAKPDSVMDATEQNL